VQGAGPPWTCLAFAAGLSERIARSRVRSKRELGRQKFETRPACGAKFCLAPKSSKPVSHGSRVAREDSDSPLAGNEARRLSTPMAEKLDLVPHTRRGRAGAKTQDPAQLPAHREPLLRRQNHAGMLASGTDPLRVK